MIAIRYRARAGPRPGQGSERGASLQGRPGRRRSARGRSGVPRSSRGCHRRGSRDVPARAAAGRAASWNRPCRPGGSRLRRFGGQIRTDAPLSTVRSVRAERRRGHARGGWAYRQSAHRPYPLAEWVPGVHDSGRAAAAPGLLSVADRSRSVAAPVRPAALPGRWGACRPRRIVHRRNAIAAPRGRGAGAARRSAAATDRVVPAPPVGDGVVRAAVPLRTHRDGLCRARLDGGRCARCPRARPDPGPGPGGWAGMRREDCSAAAAGRPVHRLVRGIPPRDTAPTGLDFRAVAHARADRHPPTNLVSIPRCHLSRGFYRLDGFRNDNDSATIGQSGSPRAQMLKSCRARRNPLAGHLQQTILPTVRSADPPRGTRVDIWRSGPRAAWPGAAPRNPVQPPLCMTSAAIGTAGSSGSSSHPWGNATFPADP